jgi:predicted kinase
MDILELARRSGMTVVLDAKIGREEYRAVHGSVAALEQLAELIAASLQCERSLHD